VRDRDRVRACFKFYSTVLDDSEFEWSNTLCEAKGYLRYFRVRVRVRVRVMVRLTVGFIVRVRI
jgi:hypothetical protein